jgi:Tol biopolymer transport system component
MALTSGTKLGPYEIVSPLGAGGMGEVYHARDTRLDRTVAIKVLPESLASDTDRLQRFEQEARVLSTLSHPNLLAIYDVGTQGGIHYLVSEFLEGQTLRERMSAGSLPQRKVREYALEIANGLAAAHDKRIVHRDLKPENIFITHDERVKILDFGLAKQSPGIASRTGESATITSPTPTTPGTVMGTVGYMSPEQVRGHAVDHRSDIFSFGAILYEMVAGKRAFKGESGVETMNAILKDDPPEMDAAQMKVSPALERIVRHCLEKSPANRFQSARDLAFALGALSGTESTAAVHPGLMPRKRLWVAWAGVGLALVATALVFLLRQGPPRAERLEFAIPVQGEVGHLALSPDGRMLAFVSPDEGSGANTLSVQRIGSSTAAVLPGTEGANYPFWSPDDAYVGFFADGKLKKVAAPGGTPQILAVTPNARGGSWGRNGIIYAPDAGGPLWRVNPDGGNAAPLTDKIFVDPPESSHRWPVFLPDGDHFLFWAGNFTNSVDDRTSGIYLSSLAAKNKTLLVLTHSNLGYSSGYLYYVDARKALIATSMDVSNRRVAGEPRVFGEGVGFQPSTYWGAFTVAENGTVVYNASSGAALSVLTWYDRAGKELGRVGDPGVLANPTISPDGNLVAVDITDVRANNVDIWIDDPKRGTTSRFTFDPAEEVAGTWSRDGAVLAFRSSAGGTSVFLKKTHGLEPEKPIVRLRGGDEIVPNSWSVDDREILCTSQPAGGGADLVLVPASGGKMVPFLASKASETSGQISPDGKWVAYASNESGDWEIYVTTFPGAAGKWQVSRGGGTEPRWRGDAKEIFYIGPKGMLTAVPVNGDGTFSTGTPAPLFQIHGRAPVSSTDLFTYDVTKDGKRLLVNRYVKPQHVAPLTVVLNASTEPQK